MIWWEGSLKLNTIAATAGNIATRLASNPYNKLMILSSNITLVCDATVANRYIQWNITDTSHTQTGNVGQTAAITASQTKSAGIVNTNGYSSGATSNLDWNIYVPIGIFLGAGEELAITIAGGVAGDSYTGYIRYIEMPA